MEIEGSTPKKRTTFYIEPNVLRNFKQICFREDVSMSRKVEKMIARYVAVHMKGNPQLRLESFIGDVQHTCFGCEGMFKTLTKVKFLSGRIGGVCPSCREDYDERRLIKKVLGTV